MTNEPGESEAMSASPNSGHLPSRIHITEFSDDRINPEPLSLQQESDLLLDEYLSTGKLRAMTGCMELGAVTVLEMIVNTTESTLGNFGRFLPNLTQLKLSNSSLSSIRDLGTSLSRLKVIWVTRCGLQDLDGLSALMQLSELYASYNNISDLSECSMLDSLQILDLEGNVVEDIHQVELLSMCESLQTLTLNNNPICLTPGPYYTSTQIYDYRREVRKSLPHLQHLDDFEITLTSTEVEERATVLTDDVLMVTDAIKTVGILQQSDESVGRPGSALRPSSRGGRPGTAAAFLYSSQRPGSASTRLGVRSPSDRPGTTAGGSRPGSSGSAPSPIMDAFEEASELTYGTGEVLCGNPIRALRARHRIIKDRVVVADEFSGMRHEVEHTYDVADDTSTPGDDTHSRDRVLAELKEWREQNLTRFSSPSPPGSSQVLTLNHDTSPVDSDSDQGDEIVPLPGPGPREEQVSPHPPNLPKLSTASYLRKVKLQQPLLPDKPPVGQSAEHRYRRLRLPVDIDQGKTRRAAPVGRDYDEAMLISNNSRSPSPDSGSEMTPQPSHRTNRHGAASLTGGRSVLPPPHPPPRLPPGGLRPASARAALRPLATEHINNITPSTSQRTVSSESA